MEEENKKFNFKNISFGILFAVGIISYAFWTMAVMLFNTFTYNKAEFEDTSAKFHTELKMIGVPEPLKLVGYDLEKGIRGRSNSKLHLLFDYNLPREDVLSYYQNNLVKNSWRLAMKSDDKWVYEKENYKITLTVEKDDLWKLDMSYIE